MSMSMGVYKGETYDNSEFIDDKPVSVQRVWRDVWDHAITECSVRVFIDCNYFSVSQIPEVLAELDRIYDWVQFNGGNDTDYISYRISDELKPYLTQFYREHKDENYWFDLG